MTQTAPELPIGHLTERRRRQSGRAASHRPTLWRMTQTRNGPSRTKQAKPIAATRPTVPSAAAATTLRTQGSTDDDECFATSPLVDAFDVVGVVAVPGGGTSDAVPANASRTRGRATYQLLAGGGTVVDAGRPVI